MAVFGANQIADERGEQKRRVLIRLMRETVEMKEVFYCKRVQGYNSLLISKGRVGERYGIVFYTCCPRNEKKLCRECLQGKVFREDKTVE